MSHYIRQNPKKTKNSDKRWSLDEDQFIIDNYASLGSKGVAAVLGRLPSACRNRAYRLKITKDTSWSPEEDKFLMDFYGSHGAV